MSIVTGRKTADSAEIEHEVKRFKGDLAERLLKDGMEKAPRRTLKIDYVKVEDIYPNDYNPNMHSAKSFDLLVKSLLYFGFTQPIVVNKPTMQIVDGENRYRAACVIGYKAVPVCFVDFDDQKLKYATIMHNAARGKNNEEMMERLRKYLDEKYEVKSEHVLLEDRGKKK